MATQRQTDIAELYIAFFGRAPDQGGLNYWDQKPMTLSQISQSFFDQPETQALYGNASGAEFISAIYENVLNRAPDQAGLNYWVGKLNSGAITKQDMILAIINGAQNEDATLMANKVETGLYWTAKGDNAPNAFQVIEETAYTPASVEGVKQWIDGTIPETAKPSTYNLINDAKKDFGTVNGTAGDDTFMVQKFKSATLFGGEGSDSLDFTKWSGTGVAVNLFTGTMNSTDTAGNPISMTNTWFENVRGTAQVDNLTGDDNANILVSGGNFDTMNGSVGNDVLMYKSILDVDGFDNKLNDASRAADPLDIKNTVNGGQNEDTLVITDETDIRLDLADFQYGQNISDVETLQVGYSKEGVKSAATITVGNKLDASDPLAGPGMNRTYEGGIKLTTFKEIKGTESVDKKGNPTGDTIQMLSDDEVAAGAATALVLDVSGVKLTSIETLVNYDENGKIIIGANTLTDVKNVIGAADLLPTATATNKGTTTLELNAKAGDVVDLSKANFSLIDKVQQTAPVASTVVVNQYLVDSMAAGVNQPAGTTQPDGFQNDAGNFSLSTLRASGTGLDVTVLADGDVDFKAVEFGTAQQVMLGHISSAYGNYNNTSAAGAPLYGLSAPTAGVAGTNTATDMESLRSITGSDNNADLLTIRADVLRTENLTYWTDSAGLPVVERHDGIAITKVERLDFEEISTVAMDNMNLGKVNGKNTVNQISGDDDCQGLNAAGVKTPIVNDGSAPKVADAAAITAATNKIGGAGSAATPGTVGTPGTAGTGPAGTPDEVVGDASTAGTPDTAGAGGVGTAGALEVARQELASSERLLAEAKAAAAVNTNHDSNGSGTAAEEKATDAAAVAAAEADVAAKTAAFNQAKSDDMLARAELAALTATGADVGDANDNCTVIDAGYETDKGGLDLSGIKLQDIAGFGNNVSGRDGTITIDHATSWDAKFKSLDGGQPDVLGLPSTGDNNDASGSSRQTIIAKDGGTYDFSTVATADRAVVMLNNLDTTNDMAGNGFMESNEATIIYNDKFVGSDGNDIVKGAMTGMGYTLQGGDDAFIGQNTANEVVEGGKGNDTIALGDNLQADSNDKSRVAITVANNLAIPVLGTLTGVPIAALGLEIPLLGAGLQVAETMLNGHDGDNTLSTALSIDATGPWAGAGWDLQRTVENADLVPVPLNGGIPNVPSVATALHAFVAPVIGIDGIINPLADAVNTFDGRVTPFTRMYDIKGDYIGEGWDGRGAFASGGEGDDTITSGKGNDVLFGGSGHDRITAGDGNDILTGDAGHDILSGGKGHDIMIGGEGDDVLEGNEDDDFFYGGTGVDTFRGGSEVGPIGSTDFTGQDHFHFAPGDSGTTPETVDRITDFLSYSRALTELKASNTDLNGDNVVNSLDAAEIHDVIYLDWYASDAAVSSPVTVPGPPVPNDALDISSANPFLTGPTTVFNINVDGIPTLGGQSYDSYFDNYDSAFTNEASLLAAANAAFDASYVKHNLASVLSPLPSATGNYTYATTVDGLNADYTAISVQFEYGGKEYLAVNAFVDGGAFVGNTAGADEFNVRQDLLVELSGTTQNWALTQDRDGAVEVVVTRWHDASGL